MKRDQLQCVILRSTLNRELVLENFYLYVALLSRSCSAAGLLMNICGTRELCWCSADALLMLCFECKRDLMSCLMKWDSKETCRFLFNRTGSNRTGSPDGLLMLCWCMWHLGKRCMKSLSSSYIFYCNWSDTSWCIVIGCLFEDNYNVL